MPLVRVDKTILIEAPARTVFVEVSGGHGPVPLRPDGASGASFPRGPAFALADVAGLRLGSEIALLGLEPFERVVWGQRRGDYERHEGEFRLAPAGIARTRLRARTVAEVPFVLPRLVMERDVARAVSDAWDATLLSLKERSERAAAREAVHHRDCGPRAPPGPPTRLRVRGVLAAPPTPGRR